MSQNEKFVADLRRYAFPLLPADGHGQRSTSLARDFEEVRNLAEMLTRHGHSPSLWNASKKAAKERMADWGSLLRQYVDYLAQGVPSGTRILNSLPIEEERVAVHLTVPTDTPSSNTPPNRGSILKMYRRFPADLSQAATKVGSLFTTDVMIRDNTRVLLEGYLIDQAANLKAAWRMAIGRERLSIGKFQWLIIFYDQDQQRPEVDFSAEYDDGTLNIWQAKFNPSFMPPNLLIG